MTSNRKRRLIASFVVILGAGGNGRVEAVKIDIATKTSRRIRG